MTEGYRVAVDRQILKVLSAVHQAARHHARVCPEALGISSFIFFYLHGENYGVKTPEHTVIDHSIKHSYVHLHTHLLALSYPSKDS